MQISITGVTEEFNRLARLISSKVEEQLTEESGVILQELKDHTPVDTGNARDHWFLHKDTKDVVSITNEVPYIENLNAGSSQQAPAFFVERIALQHGIPVGSIVTHTPTA
jgi:hypothetical protein